MLFDPEFVLGLLRIATPLIFVAMGVLIAERSGVLFIGVEGAMLVGAFAGFLGAGMLGNAWLGLVCGVLAGLLCGGAMALLTVTIPANQVVIGLAFNIVCAGITSFAFRLTASVTPSRTPLLEWPVPAALADTSFARFLVYLPPLAVLALALSVVTAWALFHTAPGLMLRSAGHNRHAAASVGVNVGAVRSVALLMAGAFAGLGGAALTAGWIRSFSDDVTMGRGFIALAAVYFGRWYPGWTVAACIIFGIGEAMSFRAQSFGGNPHFYLMIPYLLTLAGVALTGRAQGPQEAGRSDI